MKKAFSFALLAFALAAIPGVGHAQDDEADALEKRGKAQRYTVKTQITPRNLVHLES